MAVEQGTATDFLDFYNKLRDFLVSNPDLVSDGQEWAQIYGNTGTLTDTDEIVLQGPGLSGTDEIRIGLLPSINAAAGYYNLLIRGYPNWNPALPPAQQFNRSNYVPIQLWDSAMPYTFVANGRRFIAVAQVTSVVEAMYGGFFLPYALPSEYPYPLAVGGSAPAGVSDLSYSSAEVRHCHFVNPSGALLVYHPSNTWITVSNFTQGSGNSYSWSGAGALVLPYNAATNNSGFRANWANLRQCFGGAYPLHPLEIVTNSPTPGRLGVIDGCYHIPGAGTSHGSLIDVANPGDHIAIQNVFRTDPHLGYWALKLE